MNRITNGLLSVAFLACFALASSQEVDSSVEPQSGPIFLVDGNLAKSSAKEVEVENIESVAIYKTDSSLPSELKGLTNHLDRSLISITLKKIREVEHPVELSTLNQMHGLPAESPIYLDGTQLFHNHLKVYPSAIKEIVVKGTKQNPYLALTLGESSKSSSVLRLPVQPWLLEKLD
ncbi:hypothetical protein ACX3PU_07045 [Chryseobacterium sp. A301]